MVILPVKNKTHRKVRDCIFKTGNAYEIRALELIRYICDRPKEDKRIFSDGYKSFVKKFIIKYIDCIDNV